MINFEKTNVAGKNTKERNPSWTQFPNHPRRFHFTKNEVFRQGFLQ